MRPDDAPDIFNVIELRYRQYDREKNRYGYINEKKYKPELEPDFDFERDVVDVDNAGDWYE